MEIKTTQNNTTGEKLSNILKMKPEKVKEKNENMKRK